MEENLVFFIVLIIVCGFLGAVIAPPKSKFACFSLSLFFGIFGVIIAIVLRLKYKKKQQKICSFCKKTIHSEATVCPYCQSKLSETPSEKLEEKSEQTELQSVLHTKLHPAIIAAVIIGVLFILSLYFSSGCDTSKYEAEQQSMIQQVQNCKCPDGFSIIERLSLKINLAKETGAFIEVKGWYYSHPDFVKDGHVIAFEYKHSGADLKAEWLAKNDGSVEALNQLAMDFMGEKQKLSCSK